MIISSMDPSFEIRKLSPSHIRELENMLEIDEVWKRLMNLIPKTLTKNNYQCDITAVNNHKYISEHFRLIVHESQRSRRTCTEILFDEWGTSGRVRPALGHLLHLLIKANLYRAADYVAVDLLSQEKPKRPEIGPEAEISLPDIPQSPDQEENEFEKHLDQVNNVENAKDLIRTYSDKTTKRASKIPEIIVTPSVTPDIEVNGGVSPFVVPVVRKRNEEVSDMVSKSQTQEIPVVVNDFNNSEELANENSESISNESQELNIPNISLIMGGRSVDAEQESNSGNATSSVSTDESSKISESVTNTMSTDSSAFTPDFGQIMDSVHNIPPSDVNFSKDPQNVPNLTILNLEDMSPTEQNQVTSEQNSESNIPNFEILQQENIEMGETSSALPDFSVLQTNNLYVNLGNSSGNSNITVSYTSQGTTDSSFKTRSCPSPLPVLSLDTSLPHVSYQDLEMATNNFNPEQYKGPDLQGRFLGMGEFGTVFLALHLNMNKSVAVKKLNIGDVEIVNIEDEVTKQFRNEVEVLSKYKHENLLSLLGYSCDGSTYCLLYEYAPGGALKDRLQDVKNEIPWKQRFDIAVGTSRAISYLHTAFSTPLIHRDIKSANILLDANDRAKLSDFGLIKLIPNQNANIATTVFGTSAYMPREAFGGDISVKLDTFSFGVVLLELLTSLPPIDNNREGPDLVTHIAETIENDEIALIIDYKAGSWIENCHNYALDLYKLSQKCLEEKKKRPTMIEVKEALENIIKQINI